MGIRKAERKQAKLRIGIFGPSGAGKTMGALKLAKGMTNSWEKIVVIDTENKSADLYSHLGEYNVLPIDPPFTPERYIEAIRECEEAGMEVIIIDSISHEWEGRGGILEMVEEQSKGVKNNFGVWGKMTPRHNAFISAILQSKCHMICCGRSKQEYVLNQQEKNGKSINVPEKVGMKAITRDGFDFEMTISFDVNINHYASASKDRSDLFKNRDFIIDESIGKEINDWNLSGVKVLTEIHQENYVKYFELLQNCKSLEELKNIYEEIKVNKFEKGNLDELTEIIKNMKASFSNTEENLDDKKKKNE